MDETLSPDPIMKPDPTSVAAAPATLYGHDRFNRPVALEPDGTMRPLRPDEAKGMFMNAPGGGTMPPQAIIDSPQTRLAWLSSQGLKVRVNPDKGLSVRSGVSGAWRPVTARDTADGYGLMSLVGEVLPLAGMTYGAAQGAEGGALVGSALGPMGTVVGGALGTLVGAGGGYLAGRTANTAAEMAHNSMLPGASRPLPLTVGQSATQAVSDFTRGVEGEAYGRAMGAGVNLALRAAQRPARFVGDKALDIIKNIAARAMTGSDRDMIPMENALVERSLDQQPVTGAIPTPAQIQGKVYEALNLASQSPVPGLVEARKILSDMEANGHPTTGAKVVNFQPVEDIIREVELKPSGREIPQTTVKKTATSAQTQATKTAASRVTSKGSVTRPGEPVMTLPDGTQVPASQVPPYLAENLGLKPQPGSPSTSQYGPITREGAVDAESIAASRQQKMAERTVFEPELIPGTPEGADKVAAEPTLPDDASYLMNQIRVITRNPDGSYIPLDKLPPTAALRIKGLLQKMAFLEGNYNGKPITTGFKSLVRDASIKARLLLEDFAGPEYTLNMRQAESRLGNIEAMKTGSGYHMKGSNLSAAQLTKFDNWIGGYGNYNSDLNEKGITALEDIERASGLPISRMIRRTAIGQIMGTNPVSGVPTFGVPPILPKMSQTGRSMPMYIATSLAGGALGFTKGGVPGGVAGLIGGAALASPRGAVTAFRYAPVLMDAVTEAAGNAAPIATRAAGVGVAKKGPTRLLGY